jgi:cell division protein FtsB
MASIDVMHTPSEDEKVEEEHSNSTDNNEELHGLESESQPSSENTSNEQNDAPQLEEEHSETSNEEQAVEPPAPVETLAPAVSPSSDKTSSVKNKMPDFSKRDIVDILLVLLVLALALYCWSLSSSNNTLKTQNTNLNNEVAQLNANPQAIIQRQTQDLIDKVSKLMTLPSGETPTIANVTNASEAKQQSAFFKNAQNGDKVLMYVKAGEAILYRPSTNKIILVAPLTLNSTAGTTKK